MLLLHSGKSYVVMEYCFFAAVGVTTYFGREWGFVIRRVCVARAACCLRCEIL